MAPTEQPLEVTLVEIVFVAVLFIMACGMCHFAFCAKKRPEPKANRKSSQKTASDLNLVLYANGLYENMEKPNLLWTQGIEESDFNTIVLWTLHIEQNGDLKYNDHLMVSDGELQPLYGTTGTNIKSRIQELKTFGNVTCVLFSIGSGSWYDNQGNLVIVPDFYNLHRILFHGTQQQKENLFANLGVLVDLGIDGFDSDCEEWGFFSDLTYQQLEATHVVLFSELYRVYPQLIFAFVPYRDRSNWLNIAKELYQMCGEQIVRFWSVQMYGPGSGTVQSWVNEIRNNAQALGLDEEQVSNYIVPGYNNSGEYWPSNTPLRIQQIFRGLSSDGVDINGGMIWNLSQTYERGQTLLAYSQAIIEGLSDAKNKE